MSAEQLAIGSKFLLFSFCFDDDGKRNKENIFQKENKKVFFVFG